MGSSRQHLAWAAGALLLLETSVIWYLTEESFPGLIGCLLLFMIATVFPDIDTEASLVGRRIKWFKPWHDRTTHWGHWHSIVAAILTSVPLFLVAWYFGELYWGLIFSGCWILGYIVHLLCDEYYHRTGGRSWNRRAFKLW